MTIKYPTQWAINSNGTSPFEDVENHLADNIPKTRQLVCFPIAECSE